MTPIANDYPFPPASSEGKPPAARAKRFGKVVPKATFCELSREKAAAVNASPTAVPSPE